jgi:hypothetical protein
MSGTTLVNEEPRKGPERLGEAGLALHYANIISQINIIVSINLPFSVITCHIIGIVLPSTCA